MKTMDSQSGEPECGVQQTIPSAHKWRYVALHQNLMEWAFGLFKGDHNFTGLVIAPSLNKCNING